MQTILGAGGAIGTELAKALQHYTNHIRLVSRTPQRVHPSNELFPADLTNSEATSNAVKGSDTVYVTAGLKYDTKTWQQQWPVVIKNVIDACAEHQAKLVFFDNVYMYDAGSLNPMTEVNTIQPPSKKGVVRAQLAQMILDAHKDGKIEAVIARSADFYGPNLNKNTSILIETVFKPLSEQKSALWLGKTSCKHSFTYTPDAGKATALLGNTPSAYGQAWHLPTAENPYTGKEWIQHIATALQVKPRYIPAPAFFIRIAGLFSPIMRESVEMMYQYDRDYIFSSKKFERFFGISPTPYKEGISHIIATDFTKQ